MKPNILTNTKIYVNSEEESTKVQELALSLGYSWHTYNRVTNTQVPYLFFYEDMNITYCYLSSHFDSHNHKLITFKELFPMEQKTKCIVLGQDGEPKKELKPIEFVKAILLSEISKAGCSPDDYKNIELISKGYIDGHDLMFAYDDDRSTGCAYLGYWNDGVV